MTDRVVGVVLVLADAVNVLPHEAGGNHSIVGILPLGLVRGIPFIVIGVEVLANEVGALFELLAVLVLDGALEVVLPAVVCDGLWPRRP